MKGFEFVSWYGLWGPKDLPRGYRREAAGRHRRRSLASLTSRSGWPCSASSRSARRRAVRQIHRGRDGEIREDHQGREDQGGMRQRGADRAMLIGQCPVSAMKVLVLGAGVVGTTSAYYLAKAGHEVTVVDRQPGGCARNELRQCRWRLPRICRPLGGAWHANESGALAVRTACAAGATSAARSSAMAMVGGLRCQLHAGALCPQQSAYAAHRALQQGLSRCSARGNRHCLR